MPETKYCTECGKPIPTDATYCTECGKTQRAQEIDPKLAHAWLSRGAALSDLGKNEEAIKSYDKALEINPQLAQARNNREATLRDLGRKEDAHRTPEPLKEIEVPKTTEPVPTPPEARAGWQLPLASEVQKLLKSKNVDGLRHIVRSKGNAVTELLVNALDNDPDPKVKVMAIDSLGLTSDPRAVRVLMAVFDNSTGGPRQVAALSLANIVANRVKSPEAIPSLKLIAKDSTLSTLVRGQAIRALCHFRKSHDEVEQFLIKVLNDPNEDISIKVTAMT